MKNLIKTFLSMISFAAMVLPVQSMAADDFDQQDEVEYITTLENVPSFISDNGGDEFALAISDAELENYRGTFGSPTLMNSTMNAFLGGNSANNNVTGANTISDSAFSNVNGLTTVIQNSGNNVIVQNSMQVNVNMQ